MSIVFKLVQLATVSPGFPAGKLSPSVNQMLKRNNFRFMKMLKLNDWKEYMHDSKKQ